MKREEREIREEVIKEFRRDPKVGNPEAIEVAVDEGVVILSGQVDNFMDQQAAEESATMVPGVKGVVQKIVVKIPAASRRTDEEIARDSCRALEFNSAVPCDRITLLVKDGCVSLEGELDWHHQKEEAGRTVSRVRGIRGMTNYIRVRCPVSAGEIKNRIVRAFQNNARVRAGYIDVEVEEGRAVLIGEARAWIEKVIAERVAGEAPGIKEVENSLVLHPLLQGKEPTPGE